MGTQKENPMVQGTRQRRLVSNAAEELGLTATSTPDKGGRCRFQFCPITLKKQRAKPTKRNLKGSKSTGNLSKMYSLLIIASKNSLFVT